MIKRLYEELINEVHDFYKNQSFFKALKNYPEETKKLIIKFIRKKGGSPKDDSRFSDEKPIDYEKSKRPLSKEVIDYFKSQGLTDQEIKLIPQTTLSDDEYIKSANKLVSYKFNSLKDQIDSLNKEERERLINRLIRSIKDESAQAHKRVLQSTSVEDSFFGASSRSYGSDLEFPIINYNDYKINISINTNEEFFVEGHDVSIEVKKEDKSKIYKYKISMMDKINDVLEKIWSKLEKSITNFEKNIEPESEKESPKNKKYVKSDPERIVQNTFSKWYSITKTGKLREVSTDRMPADVYISKSSSGSTGRTGTSSLKDDIYMLNVKPKLKRASLDKIEKEFPDVSKWNQAYSDAMKTLTGRSFYRANVQTVLGDKLYTEEHDKFFKRLDHVLRRLMANGWSPFSTEGSHRKGEPIRILLRYDEELKDKYRDNPSGATEDFFNSREYKQVRNRLHDAKNKITDLPRLYIKNILNYRV